MKTINNYGDSNLLFLDISSSCTGYTIAHLDTLKKVVKIERAGVLWFDKDWELGRKYNYLCNFILNNAYVKWQVDIIVCEGYRVNFKKACGTLVIPEAVGAVKSTCYETTDPLIYHEIYPQTWRSILKIKKDANLAGSKAWKIPTKRRVEERLRTVNIPSTLISNITGKERTVPYDFYDSISLCLAWYSKLGFDLVEVNPQWILPL